MCVESCPLVVSLNYWSTGKASNRSGFTGFFGGKGKMWLQMFKQVLYMFQILKKLNLNFSKLVIFISVLFCFFVCLFVCTSYFVVFLSYQTNILWLTSPWKQKLCILEKGPDFSNVDYLILGPPTRFVIFWFFSLSLEGRLSSELQLHCHRVMWPDRQALGHKYRQLGSVFHGT